MPCAALFSTVVQGRKRKNPQGVTERRMKHTEKVLCRMLTKAMYDLRWPVDVV